MNEQVLLMWMHYLWYQQEIVDAARVINQTEGMSELLHDFGPRQ